jgi:branched-chain amino acid transport system permease protein
MIPLFIADVLKALDSIGVPVSQLLQMADSIAFIALAAIGLTVIFGMMGVINLAHGEFIMMGAYITTLSINVVSLPLPVAMILGALGTAAFGAIVERTIIKRLYGRLLDSMIVTFGLGLILTQGTRIIFGNSLRSIGTPFGQVPG